MWRMPLAGEQIRQPSCFSGILLPALNQLSGSPGMKRPDRGEDLQALEDMLDARGKQRGKGLALVGRERPCLRAKAGTSEAGAATSKTEAVSMGPLMATDACHD
ncbi:hypothetical protein P7K49_002716 [Saguinus oedipus]|uniref:Uncharacterized protein n=1 Tax=Saguinus oedipus TaxID=9490 RepID=A0ABQ9WIM8_SAGOE|nr:hypothetical protein P7K49_002716 [Saguinus oedipus]